MSVFKSWPLIGVSLLGMLLGACTAGGDVVATSSSSSTIPPMTTTSTLAPTSSTVPAAEVLDLSNARWVTHGLDGIRLDDGTLIWQTAPFPAGIARDREGGLVFTDSAGLWWFKAGSIEPERVGDVGAYEVVAVATTPTGPVALIRGGGPSFIGLGNGRSVGAPPDPPVVFSSQPPFVIWTADNGLSAWVTEPDVERDAEDQPSKILEPAHLVIAKGEEILVDTRIADPDQAWATIHDFDGQRLIVSRAPYEPAMPEESFLLLDLATGEATEIFRAGGTKATFTGGDTDWDGPVQPPQLAS